MRVLTEIPPVCLKDKRLGALVAREFIRALIKANEVYLQLTPRVPALYESGVRYQREPNAGKFEEFAAIPTVLERKWGDCDDLTAWRAAEIRQVEKRPADVLIYWRPNTNTWHLQVRHWPSLAAKQSGHKGSVEDPSRLLGMGVAE